MRQCEICGKILSQYNFGKYCFVHQHEGALIEDGKWERNRKRKDKERMKIYNSRLRPKMTEDDRK